LLDNIPHFATVSYAFCKRFPDELTSEIFEHILNKALNNRMVDPSTIFIDGTHIKASANKKKFQKEQVAKAAKVYSGQLRREVNAEREALGKDWNGELSYRDQLRNQRLFELGWDVKRFWVYQIRDDLQSCIEQVKAWLTMQ